MLIGACLELGGGGIPFAPLVEILRQLAGEVEPDELESLLGPARGEVGRLLPEARRRHRPAASGEGDNTARVMELLLGVISRTAAARPLVIAFEDLQWADRSTLDLIALLVRGLSGLPVLVACTVRSDELHRAHTFRRMAGRWQQNRVAERIELSRLTPAQVRRRSRPSRRSHPTRISSTSSSSAPREYRCSSRSCSARSATAA